MPKMQVRCNKKTSDYWQSAVDTNRTSDVMTALLSAHRLHFVSSRAMPFHCDINNRQLKLSCKSADCLVG